VRCTSEEPALRRIEGGHLVACHFADQPDPASGAASAAATAAVVGVTTTH
jgi:hypothetical protein